MDSTLNQLLMDGVMYRWEDWGCWGLDITLEAIAIFEFCYYLGAVLSKLLAEDEAFWEGALFSATAGSLGS